VEKSKAEKIQSALYQIADAASAMTDMQEFYATLHRIVRELIYAENFYVTLYDPVTQMINAPYFADEAGDTLPPPSKLEEFSKSLRAYVLNTGRTLHLSAEDIEEGRSRGEFTPMGTLAEDWIGVPLKVGGQTIGSLTIQSYRKGLRYREQDVQLLEFVAQHIAVALNRARAIDETRQRNAELQIINSVQEGLASRLDMSAIYELVGDKIRVTFNAQVVSIDTYDHTLQLLQSRYYFEGSKALPGATYPCFGFRKHVIENRRPLVIDNDMLRWMEEYNNPVNLGAQPKSAIFVPMIVGDEAIGVISLQNNDQENAFSDADLRLLTTLTNSMSIALENARLFDETQRLLKETEQRAQELAIINSVQAALAAKLDIQGIYEAVGDKIREIFHNVDMGIRIHDPKTNLISYPYTYENGQRIKIDPWPLPERGFGPHVLRTRKSLMINENFAEEAEKYGSGHVPGTAHSKSLVVVPLVIGNQARGLIDLTDTEKEHAFKESDVRLLETLANAMSIALENAHLFDETQHLLKETEQRAQELATVNTVSSALSGELDLNKLIELIGEQIRTVFQADIAFVALLDKEHGIINFPYQYGQQHIDPIQWGQGITSKVIQSGQPLMINQDMDRQRQQMGVTLIGKRARSFLGVPIFVGNESIGVVSVQYSQQEGIFTENDQRLLSTIASNVGIAFQNAHLFHAERQAYEQAETLRSVAQALNRSLSLREVFDLVLTEIQKVIPYDSAGIYQVQDNHRVLVAGRGFSNLEDLIGTSFDFNRHDDEIGYLISKSLHPLILEDALKTYPQYFGIGLHAATKIRSYMAVPIVLNQKLIGMITLDREDPGLYKDQQAKLAMAFAAQAATAINNARLFNETQRLLKETEQRNAELAIINSVQRGLASRLAIQAIYDLVGDRLRDVFHNMDVEIRIYDSKTNMIHNPYTYENGKRITIHSYSLPERGFVPHVLHTLENLVVNEGLAQEMEKYGSRIVTGTQMSKSLMMVPLVVNNLAHGLITISDMQHEYAFKESDVRLLQTLSNSMSVALENARLWEEEKMYRKALERELEIGREIQAGFLPEALPLVEGWEIAASLMSAREVAGDFYDVFELPDGTIGLVIADVCDKGVGAALFMTLFRSLIRVTANLEYFEHGERTNSSHSIPDRLKRAMLLTNNYIAETHGDSGMFATLFFGVLDPRDGKLTYVNGGHEPPLIVRSGAVHETLYKTGPAVGVIMDCHFDLLLTQLNVGDTFIAFTDGVPDCSNSNGEFFGRERLLDILQRSGGSVPELVRRIETELLQFTDSATQFDDITLLAVRHSNEKLM